MESNYDEDLNENSFFQTLQTDHPQLFEKATVEGWIVCVPRSGSLPKYSLTHEDFFSHILIPSDELPESHFRTLNDKDVRICNRVVTVEQHDIARPYSTHILFEETYYTEDLLKYKVLCIENPLERRSDLGSTLSDNTSIVTIQTLRDCIDLLWTESVGKEVLEKLDECIKNFLSGNPNLEFEPLQVQKDTVSGLYTVCLQTALRNSRLREKTSSNKYLLESVKLSVETYMHHGIYKKLIKGITACTAYEDSCLNKIVRNLSDIQLRDLGVRLDLFDTVPRARQELARVDGYSTVLGKICCLRRMVSAISKQSVSENASESTAGNVVAADDLLPMIIFLVIKTSLPNWIAHLTYMKQFHFSASSTWQVDERSFLITSLEAAIEQIKIGILHGPSAPESQFTYENDSDGDSGFPPDDSEASSKYSCVAFFFEQVKLGATEKVKEILDKNSVLTSRDKSLALKRDQTLLSKLCHPLCSCDKCESLLSKNLCDTTPTVHSCDDRGFTALHVACMFGRPMVVDLLVNRGAKVNSSDYSGSTPLHYAAAKGHQNALLLLLHSGGKFSISDNEGNTPLHLASNNGHEECVKALLYFAEHTGIALNPNVANSHGDTPLHHAARWGYEGIVQILLDHGGRADVENKRRLTPMDYAHSLHVSGLLMAKKHSSQTTYRIPKSRSENYLLREQEIGVAASTKSSLDFTDDCNHHTFSNSTVSDTDKLQYGIRPQSTEQIKKVDKLLRAIAFGDVRLACYYLGLDGPFGIGEDAVSPDVKSLCHPLCTCEKCKPVGEVLEENKTVEKEVLNVNVCNSEGFTALHVASIHGRTEVAAVLLDAGANINVQTRTKGATPLHLACQNQQMQVVKLLLQSGNCNVDLQDMRGNTALHNCCFTGNIRLVELILKYGPRLDLKNVDGKTPVEEAEEKTLLTVIRLLKGGKPMSLSWQENGSE